MLSTKKSLLRKLGCNKAALARPPFTMPHKKQDTKDKNQDSKEKLSIFIKKFNSQDSLSSGNSKTGSKNGNFKVINRSYNASVPQKSSLPSMHKDKTNSFINPPKKLKVDTMQSKQSIPQEPSNIINKAKKISSMYPPNTYICKFCCRRFYSFESLQQHAITHGSEPKHICYLCKHQAASFSALMSHHLKHSEATRSTIEKITAKNNRDICNVKVNIASAPKSSIRCIHCKVSFSTKDKFNTHHCTGIGIKHEYNCAYCGKISKTVHEYRDHVLSHSVIPFVCTYCGCKFQKKKGLDKHKETCSKIPKRGRPALKCTKCCIQFKKNLELIKHTEVCHSSIKDKEFLCILCNAKFTNELEFSKHKETCEKISKAVVKKNCCSSCGVKFKKQTDFDKHVEVCGKVSDDNTKLACSSCSSVFMKQLDYSKHIETCKKSSISKNNTSCSLMPENQSELDEQVVDFDEIYVKSEENKLSCDSCSSKFKKQLDLDRHVKTCGKSILSAPETLACSSCGEHFEKQNEFEDHMKVCIKPTSVNEENSSETTINILSKSQATKSIAVNRKSRKTTLKEFSCSSCNSKFKKQLELKKHIKVCTNINFVSENTCSTCNTSFHNNSEFDEHVKLCNPIATKEANYSSTDFLNQSTLNDGSDVFEKSAKIIDELVCPSCKCKFQNQLTYDKHLKHCKELEEPVSSLKNNFSCSLCGVVFDSRFNLDLHSQFCMVFDNSVCEESFSQENLTPQRRSARLVYKKISPTETKKKRKRKSQQKKICKNLKVAKCNQVKLKISTKNKVSRKVKKEPNVSLLCNLCNYGFSSKSSLLRHKRMHSGNPWFTCKYCGKFFFRKDNYLRHELNVHSKSDDQMLCCCYCRLYYNSFATLKDHVFAMHKDNSFLPITLPQDVIQNETLPSPSVQDVNVDGIEKQSALKISDDDNKDVLKALLSKNKKSTTDSEAIYSSNMNFFKCGICSLAHKRSSDLKNHFLTFHQVPQNIQSTELELLEADQNKNHDLMPVEKNAAIILKTKTAPQTNDKNNLDENVQSCVSKSTLADESNKSEETSEINNTFQIESLASEVNESSEVFPDISLKDNLVDPLSCKLCSKSFLSKSMLNIHEDTAHKLVEWFQCLVCDSSGPKDEMVTHMMNHMYKVGTFIVNSDHRNFDNILPYLPQTETASSSNCLYAETPSISLQTSEPDNICGNVNEENNVRENDNLNCFLPQLKGLSTSDAYNSEDSQETESTSHQKSGTFNESFESSSKATDDMVLHGRDVEIGNTSNNVQCNASSEQNINDYKLQSRTSSQGVSTSESLHRASVRTETPVFHDFLNGVPVHNKTITTKSGNGVESRKHSSQTEINGLENVNCNLNQSLTSNFKKVCDNSDEMEIVTFDPLNRDTHHNCNPSSYNSPAESSAAVVSDTASNSFMFSSNNNFSVSALTDNGTNYFNNKLHSSVLGKIQNKIPTIEDKNSTDIVQHFNTDADMFRNLSHSKDSHTSVPGHIAPTPVRIGKQTMCNDCNFVFHSGESQATHQCTDIESKSFESMSHSSNYNNLDNNQSFQNPQLLRSLLMSNEKRFGISSDRSSGTEPSQVNDSFLMNPSSESSIINPTYYDI